MSPSTLLARPLAPVRTTPVAISKFPTALLPPPGAARNRKAERTAPSRTMIVATPEANAARSRGRAGRTSEPRARRSTGSGAVIGTLSITPSANAQNRAINPTARRRVLSDPCSIKVPPASTGTFTMAPNR